MFKKLRAVFIVVAIVAIISVAVSPPTTIVGWGIFGGAVGFGANEIMNLFSSATGFTKKKFSERRKRWRANKDLKKIVREVERNDK